MCDKTGCVNEPEYVLGANLWAVGADKDTTEPAEVHFGLMVCIDCSLNKMETVEEFFAQGSERIVEVFKRSGNKVPDFSTGEWIFTPIKPRTTH